MTNNSDAMQLPLATLVVIDAQVDDYEVLLNGVVDGASTLLLDPRRDGVEQITEALAGSATPISSLHIVSHGSPGTLYLGSTQLSLETLAHYAPQLSRWFENALPASPHPHVPAFSSTPSLLLYGCNIAAGDAGEEFIQKLHRLTGACISASSNKTGHPSLNADWNLERSVGGGDVVAKSALGFSAVTQQAYLGTFAPPTNDNFANRIVLTGTNVSTTGTTVEATGETGEPEIFDSTLESVWWTWTAPATGTYQIDTIGSLASSGIDTTLAVYTGTELNSLSLVGNNDDFNNLDSGLVINATAGTTYQIQIDGLGGDDGAVNLNITQLSSTDSDGGLIAGTTISEPVALPAESDTLAEAVSLFDFAITDGGSSDGLDLTVTQVRVSTAGSTGDPSQVTWLLSGPDLGTDVVGSYSGGVITFDVSGTPITVADGNTVGEAYTVKAYVNGTVNSGQTFNLSIDGDTDLTVDGAGTQMGTTNPVNNGSGSVVTVIPLVQSITLNDPNPTNANTLNFTVTFNQAVTGVDVSDFSINAAIGIVGEAVSTVSGSGTTYIVTVATGTGEGNLRLDVVDNDSIISQSTGVKLGGSGLGNGNFNSGPSYNIDRTAPSKPSNLDLANDGTSDSGVQDDKITNNSQPSITGTAAANATIEIRDSLGNLIGTGSTGGSSTFNVPLTAPLTEGPNTLSVTVTDAAGNESAVTQVTITLDTTAPNAPGAIALTTATDSGVDGDSITNNTTPSLTGTAEANSTITIRNASDQVVGTGTTSGAGTWTVNLTSALTAGDNTLFVTATDAAGNTTVTPAQTVVTIDTVAEPIIANLDATSDSGEFDNDGITSDTTPTISGIAEANSTIEIVVPDGFGGETLLGTGTADGSGNWSLELSPAFSEDGTYTVGVRATDVAGNVATTTAGFVIDTTAPVVPTVDALITNNNTPTLSGTFAEGNALEVTVNGVTYTLDASQELSNNGNIWTLNLGGLAVPLTDDTYDVSVTTTDLAGNSSSDESSGELTVDTLPPTAPTVDGLVTQDSTPILTGTYTPGDILTIVVGGNTYTLGDPVIADSPELTTDQAGNWTLDLSAITPLADNTYDVTATAEDAAGNTSTDGTSGELVVDTTAPDAPTADLSDLDNSGSVNDLITNVAQPTLSGTAEANSTVTVTYGETSQEVFTANGDWEITLNTGLTEGDNLISVTATDEAGNESTATELTVTLDTLIDAPTVGLAEGSDTGVPGDNITNTTTPALTGSTEPGATVKIYAGEVLEANLLGTVTADGTGVWTFNANLAEGSHILLVTATDLADNTSQPAPLTVDVDLTPPTAPTVNTVGDNTGFPTLSGTFTEGDDLTVAIAGTGLSFSLDDPELSSDGAGNWTLNLSNLADPVSTGTYNVIATATDVAGNNSADVSTGELTIDITPPTAPTVNSLLTQSNQPVITGTFDPNDFTSFTVEIVGVDTYTLGIDGILSVNGNTWELDLTGVVQLSDGTYEVIATATDEAGNASTDASSGELIIDTMAPGLPTINLTASSDSGIQGDNITNDTTPTLEGSAEANSEVFISGGGINTSVFADSEGVWSFTPTVDVVGAGGGDVTFTAIAVDAAGNASNPANLTINVDLTAPTAPSGLDLLTADDSGSSNSDDLTKDNTPRISGTAEAGTTVELFNGETSLGTAIADQSGQWTITSTALTGSNSGISYDLTATATDSVGNESVLSAPLTVVIDTGIDKPSAPAIAEEDDTGLSSSDNVTNNNQPRFTGVAEPGSTVTVRSNRNGVLGTALLHKPYELAAIM